MRNHIKITCPRRMTEWGTWERAENLDHWRLDSTCSFCGSYKPDLLLNGLARGEFGIEPTDKSYKIYVNGTGAFAKFYFQHFSVEQQEEFITLYNMNPRPFKVAFPGYFYVKPYFTKVREVNDGSGG